MTIAQVKAAPITTLTTIADVENKGWFAPNSGDTARPRRIVISQSVTGVVPYHDRGSANAFNAVGNIGLIGHPDIVIGRGGFMRFGNTSNHDAPTDSVWLRDLTFAPGIHPIADPANLTGDSRPANQRPFFGESEPDESWAQSWDSRDGLSINDSVDVLVEHVNFAHSCDGLCDAIKQVSETQRIGRIRFRYCAFGPSLANPDDQGIPHGGAARLLVPPDEGQHNFGGFFGDGNLNDMESCFDVSFQFCLFVCNRNRSPAFGIVNGLTVDNCIIYNRGVEGIGCRNPDSSEPYGTMSYTRAMARGNLFIDGPNSPGPSDTKIFWLVRCREGARFYIAETGAHGNWRCNVGVDLLDGANYSRLTRANSVSIRPLTSSNESWPSVIVRHPLYQTAWDAELMPTDTPSEREALLEHVIGLTSSAGRVGPRLRDGSGNPQIGDANTNYLLRNTVLPGVRAGTLANAKYPSDAPISPFSEEALALFRAFTVEPTTAEKALYSGVISQLIDADIWNDLDVLHLPVHYDNGFLLNWRNPGTFTATVVGTPTFTAFSGVATDGATNLVKLYNPATAGGLYTQNSAHFGIWVNPSTPGQFAGSPVGRFDGTQGTSINPRNTNNQMPMRINQLSSSSTATNSALAGEGHTIANRSGATAIAVARNGAGVALNTNTAAASVAIVNATLVIGALNDTPAIPVNVFAAHAGGSLTAQKRADFFSILSAYRTAVFP